jgi:hypothetical protein
MPLFACRWPNGDVSFVLARNKEAAIEELDEVDNAEGCPIVPVQDFQVHFRLDNGGELRLEQFGERVEQFIWEDLYPALDAAWSAICDEQAKTGTSTLTPAHRERIRQAVEAERGRVHLEDTPAPQTELAKDLKKMTSMPSSLVNKYVRAGAKKALKAWRPKGKRH